MTEDSNQVDNQAEEPLSLRDELAKQLTQAEKPVEEAAEQEEVITEEATEEVEEEVTEEAEVKEEVAEEKTEASNVPNNWNDEEKKAFEDIPDNIITEDGTEISLKAMKDVALNRNEELLKAFNEKAREASTAKKGSEEWNKLLDPYKPQLTATGQSAQQWIGSILQTVHSLQANPKVVIKNFIDTYKVSASDLGYEQSEDEDDFHGESNPKVTKLETENKELLSRLDALENANVQRGNQTVQDEIATFKDAKDVDGNLTHPHFDEARDEMGILMQTGKAKTIQEAYEKSPTVRSKGIKVVKTDNGAALKKAREEAAKAKRAGKTVKTRSGQPANRNNLSLREALQKGIRAGQ